MKKAEGEMTNIKYFCHIEEMFNTLKIANLKACHKKEKPMEAGFKKLFFNITKEVIKIYLDLCDPCTLKKN